MDRFVEALLADKCNNSYIPKEDDWFEGLIGDWSFIWKGSDGREVEGEWFFRKVLEGCAIEDIFISPSRKTREINPQPDGEYGAALRVYNREKRCYDMTYVCQRYTVHLVVHKKDRKIQCEVIPNDPNQKERDKWVFAEITPDSFHWQNITVLGDGTERINANIYATRI